MKLATRFINFLEVQEPDSNFMEKLDAAMEEFKEPIFRLFHAAYDEEDESTPPPNTFLVFNDMSAIAIVFNPISEGSKVIIADFDNAFDAIAIDDLLEGVKKQVNKNNS